MIIFDVYGCDLDAVSRRALREYPLEGVLVEHGRIERDPNTGKSGREIVLAAMRITDVLVILHDGEGSISQEYIPSKLYEYLLTGRPVLGLTTTGTELEEFLIETGHVSVNKDDVSNVGEAIKTFIERWQTSGLDDTKIQSTFTVAATVNKLISAVSNLGAVTKRRAG